MHFHIQNMSCGGCARSVAEAIQSIDPAARVAADLAGRKVEVVSDRPRTALEFALAEAGFPSARTGR